jgi:hypothetical protein
MTSLPSKPLSRWGVRGVVAVLCLGSLSLHLTSLVRAQLLYDDFDILQASWTWLETVSNLWQPMNEHSWPLTRLTTSAVVEASGHRQTLLPLLAAIPPRLALLGALLLTFRFATRHTGSQVAGVAGMIVFGLTAAYQEALYWYAAHPPLWCVCCALLALTAADRWHESGRWWRLAEVGLWAFVAPCWFAGGVIVGPLVGLYLVLSRRWWQGLIPFGGALLFLFLSWMLAGDKINRPHHFEGKSMLQSLDPVTGAGMTARAVVDQIAVASVGWYRVAMPIPVVAVVLPLMVAVAVWWWWRAADRRLVLVGAGFILGSDLLIYSARGEWSYAEQLKDWSRYNVFPWFGQMLMIVGGVRWPTGALTRRQTAIALGVAVVLFAVQLPRGMHGSAGVDPEQSAVLRRVEEIDRRCREHRISATAARQALPPVTTEDWLVQGQDDPRNCLELLWGSPTPEPRSADEVRRLLGD